MYPEKLVIKGMGFTLSSASQRKDCDEVSSLVQNKPRPENI